MEQFQFIQPMAKGHCPEQEATTPENCTYSIFYTTSHQAVSAERISVEGEDLLLELWYVSDQVPGYLRIRQIQTNVLIEESLSKVFLTYLLEKQPKYIGHVIMYALLFKIENTGVLLDACSGEMKLLEDELDNCIDNDGTYQILDFRRKYVGYGDSILALQQILSRIDKGYYPMQMQNSYVLQGEINLAFNHLERRYDLLKGTLIKDLDTYTSIVNNNINRSGRSLSIISLVGVVLNFLFGSLLVVNPLLGVAGGVVIASLSVGATLFYRVRRRNALNTGFTRLLTHKKQSKLEVIPVPIPDDTQPR